MRRLQSGGFFAGLCIEECEKRPLVTCAFHGGLSPARQGALKDPLGGFLKSIHKDALQAPALGVALAGSPEASASALSMICKSPVPALFSSRL